jgi:acetylornithine deacetylase/succinyl-diaminopimelate desuccinylase-like protein
MAGAPLEKVLAELASGFAAHRAALAEFVAIPSVSTDPAHAADVARAADWVAGRLRDAGPLEVERVETGGHPAVLASWDGAPGAPTVLIYGHMDVQPPDPLDAWTSDPFTLTERDGRWYARGISDDKGSMLIPILVTQAFFRHGTPPVNLRFLFEAEEEVGSPHLPELVRARAGELACDVVLSADGGMWRADLPSITTSARGMTGLELRVRGPAKDLHSGRHGGAVHNPLHALATLLAGLHDEDGRVTVDGFYDGIEDPTPERLAELDALPFDDGAYLTETGAPATFGEAGYGTLARQWLRPTLEVNGVGGGYQGPGSKTVLPSSGFAKITCRLVAGQDPVRIADAIEAHLRAHAPTGVTVEVVRSELGADAYRVRDDHPALDAAEAVLEEVLGRPPVRVGMGGSVPITATFRDVLGVDTLFFSFSTADEDIHAPNEFYRPERFRAGMQAWARLWARLAEDGAAPDLGDPA